MTQWHLRLFGPPVLRGSGGEVHFRTRKQLGLCVYLVLEARQRAVARETLVDLFWPGTSVDRGRHSLSQALTALRGHLGRRVIEPGQPHIRFEVPLATDLDLLPHGLNGAVDLAHPLQGLDRCGGPEFAHWVDAARAWILAMTRSALLDDMRALRVRGDVARVREQAARLYRVDPLNDQAVTVLAEGALLDGDARGAEDLLTGFLKTAREVRGPSECRQVTRLLSRIESGVPPLVESAARNTPVAEARPDNGVFVGRQGEVARLEGLWDRARRGGFTTCLVTGSAGIGKSVLLRRFATSITARGWPVLMATCHEVGSGIPFGTLTDLITSLSRDAALGGTDPHWLAEASRIAPALKTKYPGIPEPPPVPGESVRLRVAEAFCRMIEAVADGEPVLVVVDDVQHIDPASREVLHLLGRRMQDQCALLLAARRSQGLAPAGADEDAADLKEWQETVGLRPLQLSETNTLIAALTRGIEEKHRHEVVVRKIAGLSDGNPYFIEMLVADWKTHADESLAAAEAMGDGRAARWRPPATMRVAFSRHYDGLSRDARDALNVLAVAGRAMDAREIGDFLQSPSSSVRRCLFEIMATGILRSEAGAVSFKNELHRAFVYYSMPEDARTYYHVQFAYALAATEVHSGQHLLEAAHHYGRGGLSAESLDAAMRGARLALGQGAPREAEKALNEALTRIDEPQPPEAMLLLAEAMNQRGNYDAGRQWLKRVRTRELDPWQRATAARLAAEGMVRGRLGDEDTIKQATADSLGAARQANDDLLVARALQLSAEMAADMDDLTGVQRIEMEARAASDSCGRIEPEGYANLTVGFCLYTNGRYAEAYRHLARSAAVLRETNGAADLIRAVNGLGMCAHAVGEQNIALAAFEEALQLAERAGDYTRAANVASNMGTMLADFGLVDEGDRCFEKSLGLLDRTTDTRYDALIFDNLADLRIIQGDFAGAAKALDRAESAFRKRPLVHTQVLTLTLRADLCIAQGRPDEACGLISQVGDLDSKSLAGHPCNSVRLELYRAWRNGDLEAAKDLKFEPMAADRITLTGFVEISAFKGWLAEQVGGSLQTEPTISEMIRATGLYGVEMRLRALGLYPRAA